MMPTISFTVPAVPIAQPRPRAVKIGSGPNARAGIVSAVSKHPVNDFKATVRLAAQQAYHGPPIDVPCRVDCVFVFPRQSSKVWKTRAMPRYPHDCKPDRDNLDKSVLDALKGTVLKEDAWCATGGYRSGERLAMSSRMSR